ncbi:trypco2 family protein [Kitasatospora sp. NPDC051853]|uniref:trypco2 family protein n=1 Tax=Kitasatospora sp. NPDC051853 TaxID=3364058 RepID=UPI0037A0D79A
MTGRIGLTEAVAALQEELAEAARAAEGRDLRFPVEGVTLEFQVAVTLDAQAGGKAKFWVLELGADSGYSRETVQTVTLQLGPPVDRDGESVLVSSRPSAERP